MSTEHFDVYPFDPHNLSEEGWESYFTLCAVIHNEVANDPDDSPTPKELERRQILDPDPIWNFDRWLAWNADQSEVIGYAYSRSSTPEDPAYEFNRQTAQVYVRVLPDARRQGVGTQLLKRVVENLNDPALKYIETYAMHPTGQAFSSALGGEVSLEAAVNRLKLSDVDWSMIEQWASEGPKRAPGVKIEMFERCPEELVADYCEIYTETVNQQPLGQMGTREAVTPERLRRSERRRAQKGLNVLTMITSEPDGAISGLTETLKIKGEDSKIHQLLTGVRERYRNKGLGKWLKAEMLLEVRRRYPAVKAIYTGNANENAPMVSINQRLGFEHYYSDIGYKYEIGTLRSRLGL